MCRYVPSCGFCDCRRVGSIPGDRCSTPLRLTVSRPVRTSPDRLTPAEVRPIEDMVTALEYCHVPAPRSPSSLEGVRIHSPRPTSHGLLTFVMFVVTECDSMAQKRRVSSYTLMLLA